MPHSATSAPPGGAVSACWRARHLVVKFAAKAKALLLLAPKLKLFTTSASMLVSIGAYSLIWGWKFAIGFVLLLLVHELGHVIQLRREGIPASAPMFIPFLGALVAMKELPKDAAAEARVGLAGPVLGLLAALVPLALYGLDRRRAVQGARVRRLLPQPVQPPARAAARRRPRDGGAVAVDVAGRLRAADRRGGPSPTRS